MSRRMTRRIVISLFRLSLLLPILCAHFAIAAPAGEARLLRFPAIHGDKLVFGYAGDLYTVSAKGGIARRLTSDEQSYEMFPRFSPDGKNLAFTAQYDGNTEVYVMPADGGAPRRLTYTATLERDDVSDRMGPNNIVMTWRDNESVIYRSRRTQLFACRAGTCRACGYGCFPGHDARYSTTPTAYPRRTRRAITTV